MSTPRANQIVDRLLEADDTGVYSADVGSEISRYMGQIEADRALGKIDALTPASTFWHKTLTYKDGVRPLQVRRNGRTKTWVRRPGEFRIPCKYGMYEYFDITDKNANEWTTVEPPPKQKQKKLI